MDRPYLMALFTKTKEVEVVPKNWIIEEDGRKYCYWARFTDKSKVYSAARNQDDPNKKVWKRLLVRVFFQFDDYDRAVSEIPHFLEHSDYDISGASKKVSKTSVVSKSSSESIDGSDSDRSEESVSAIGRSFTFAPVELPEPPLLVQKTPAVSQGLRREVRPKILNFETSGSSSTAHSSRLIDLEVDAQAEGLGNYDNRTILCDHTQLRADISDLKQFCARNFASLKLQQSNLVASVENLNIRVNLEAPQPGTLKSSDFGFPFKEMKELLEFESKIQADPDFREMARAYLSRMGGEDVTEVTNNIFRILLVDELCQKFTLYGTVDKSSFAKLECFNLVVDTVNSVQTTKNATVVQIKKAVMSWLQHTTDRIKAQLKSTAKKLAKSKE